MNDISMKKSSQALRDQPAWVVGLVVACAIPIVTGLLFFADLAWVGVLLGVVLFAIGYKFPNFDLQGISGRRLMMVAGTGVVLAIVASNALRNRQRANQVNEVQATLKGNPAEAAKFLAEADAETLKLVEELDPVAFARESSRRSKIEISENAKQAAIEMQEAAIQGERRRKEWAALEIKNAPEIAKLKTELNAIKRNQPDDRIAILEKLAILAPGNSKIGEELIAMRTAKLDSERQFADPASFLQIRSFDWWKGGFGSIMMASFSIKNNATVAMSDIRLICTVYGESGTAIAKINKTVFVKIPAKGSKRVGELNLGFVNSQASTGGCIVEGATPG